MQIKIRLLKDEVIENNIRCKNRYDSYERIFNFKQKKLPKLTVYCQADEAYVYN